MSKLTEEFHESQDRPTVDYRKLDLAKHVLTTRHTLTVEEVIKATNEIYEASVKKVA